MEKPGIEGDLKEEKGCCAAILGGSSRHESSKGESLEGAGVI